MCFWDGGVLLLLVTRIPTHARGRGRGQSYAHDEQEDQKAVTCVQQKAIKSDFSFLLFFK